MNFFTFIGSCLFSLTLFAIGIGGYFLAINSIRIYTEIAFIICGSMLNYIAYYNLREFISQYNFERKYNV
jgi:hypothetical protein